LRREIEHAALPQNLQAFRDFIEKACRGAGVELSVTRDLKIAVDEACSNIVEHGYARRPPGSIGVSFEANGEKVVIRITDRGNPFDAEDAPAPDLDSDWRSRRVGGLGWSLIRKLVDEVAYGSDPKTGNRLTLIKKTSHADPGGGREED